jgi:hypothetical protein
MALPSSGAISFNAINVELGVAGTTTANINQTSYRTLAGVPSGTISLSNFYGKSNAYVFNATISADTQNYNLRSAAIAAGWNQTTKLQATVTINSGIYVGSSTTGGVAFTWTGSYPSGSTLAIVNNGTIEGAGGNGGAGGDGLSAIGTAGSAGGAALQGNYAISITNNNIVGGGGGGGGGAGNYYVSKTVRGAGGGGGGGAGYALSAGGAAGQYAGTYSSAGSAGTKTSGGAGGAGWGYGQTGASGGSRGATGGIGPAGTSGSTSAGGAGGNCTVSGTNAYITWTATGTRLGALG